MIINLKLLIKFKLVNVANLDFDQVANLLISRPVVISQEVLQILIRRVLTVLRVQASVASKQYSVLVHFDCLWVIGVHVKQLLELLYYMLQYVLEMAERH